MIRAMAQPDSRALAMVHSSRLVRYGGAVVLVVLLGLVGGVAIAPWQQHLVGAGRVVAFAPLERQQPIEAPISGRIVNWWVQEGSQVAGGDPLLEIRDIDPGLVGRLERERVALVAKIAASEGKIDAYLQQVASLEDGRDLAVAAAQFRIETAAERVRGAGEARAAAQATLQAAGAQFDRMRNLLDEGIVSRREFELAERDRQIAQTTLAREEAMLRAAEADLSAVRSTLEEIRATAQAKIDAAVAMRNDASSQLEDARVSLARLEVQIARQASQMVVAPRDGTVLRLIANQGGEVVSAGDPLLVLVPETEDRAVELWVSGNDAPLVAPDRPVRLQFEGWPAIQFVGWPSVAVGTFGGRVAFVDSTDDGKGRFRVVVRPDPQEPDWPEPRFLRQGVRAKGWVLLDQVSLSYELWRQLNGFPPVTAAPDSMTGVARKRLK